jgi:nucleotide-binding universal stress UspA family protein
MAWHVPPGAYGGPGFAPPYEPHRMFERGVRETLDGIVARVKEESVDVQVEPVLREGQAAAVPVEESEDADLLVVGSRGHAGFAGLLLGSVSLECGHAQCPVLIVREPARADTIDP